MRLPVSEPSRASLLHAIRVLVVDDEVNLRFAIERGLRKAGHHADSASTVRQAIDRLRTQPYDIVITDLRMPGGDGIELVQWLGSYSPSTKVLIISGYITEAVRLEYGKQPTIRLLEKPVELATLITLVEDLGPRRGFYGNSIEVELFDYVQMVALSGRDKMVKITTPISEGLIWFEHGDIVHATFQQWRGELAFYKMLAVGRGTFSEMLYQTPPKRTIMGSSTGLLMEAARQMDEGILGEDPAGSETSHDDESSFADLNEDPEPQSAESTSGRPSAAMLLSETGEIDLVEEHRGHHHHAVADNTHSATGLLDDPETRELMLGQFFEFEGVNGVAIISSTGKVLAEKMQTNAPLVTLAGFYMRGAARIARSLGYNVFDGVIARVETGQQLVMVGMGATSAVLSIAAGHDPEQVRDEIMGYD
jgi:CheY-like chemotaxis protein